MYDFIFVGTQYVLWVGIYCNKTEPKSIVNCENLDLMHATLGAIEYRPTETLNTLRLLFYLLKEYN